MRAARNVEARRGVGPVLHYSFSLGHFEHVFSQKLNRSAQSDE
jgi:hypothetical protein